MERLAEVYEGDEEMSWAIESLKHLEQDGVVAAAGGNAKKACTLNAEVPGAGRGERWFGKSNLHSAGATFLMSGVVCIGLRLRLSI